MGILVPIFSWNENINVDELLKILAIWNISPIINKIVDKDKDELDFTVIDLNKNQDSNLLYLVKI